MLQGHDVVDDLFVNGEVADGADDGKAFRGRVFASLMVDEHHGAVALWDDGVAIEQEGGVDEVDGFFLGERLWGDHLERLTLERGVEDDFFAGELDVERDDGLDRRVGKIDFDGRVAADGRVSGGGRGGGRRGAGIALGIWSGQWGGVLSRDRG